jgi:hypothetical protein
VRRREFQQFLEDFPGANGDLFTFLNLIGPTLIQNIVTPGALGVQFFTVLKPLRHFQCCSLSNERFDDVPVTLTDRFGSRSVEVRRANDLCFPADKSGEDPTAPSDPDHLTAYRITRGGPFDRVRGQTVVKNSGSVGGTVFLNNQFGRSIASARASSCACPR